MLLSMLLTLAVQAEGLSQESPVTFPTLVDQVATLDWILQPPRAGEHVENFDLRAGGEGGELVLRLDGAGALARLWLSDAVGTLSLQLDGQELAVLPADLRQWQSLAVDQLPLWQQPPFMATLGRGWSSHLPLPFESKLELHWQGIPSGARLQAGVHRFGEGAAVQGLSAAQLNDSARVLRRSLRLLNAKESPATPVQPAPFKVGGARKRAADAPTMTTNGEFRWPIQGHGVLRWFELDFIHKDAPAPPEELLRSLVLRIEIGSADLEKPGTVLFRVPLGDFFGSGPGIQAWQSPWMGYDLERNVFYFRLPIPYQDGIKICVESDLPGIARFRVRAGIDPVQYATEVPPLRLHAGWLPAHGAGLSEQAVLETEGPARLAALSFTATSPSLAPFRHDGPFAFASSWSAPVANALEQVTLWQGPGNFGRSSMIRLFGLDGPVAGPGEALRVPAGVLFDGEGEVDYSVFAWWYAPMETASNLDDPGELSQRLATPLPEASFPIVAGAFEGELATGVLRAPGTSISRIQAPLEQGFSRAQFLEWEGVKAMDNIVIPFPVIEAGRYRLAIGLAQGPNRGKVQVMIDGRPVGEAIDCYADQAGAGPQHALGELRMLPRLDHKCGLRSLDGKAVGIDYLLLEAIVAAPEGD